jgi:predicted Fe-Mo cluster-binding NifX family protein
MKVPVITGAKLKIAVITEDETTVSQHFGMAPNYSVLTVENGKIVNTENRPKMGHQHFSANESQPEHGYGQIHCLNADSKAKHMTTAQPISDCEVLIAGGMGKGAYESIKSYNIVPIITDIKDISNAVNLYIYGKLPNCLNTCTNKTS